MPRKKSTLSPDRSIKVIVPWNILEIMPEKILPQSVGWKAFGLASTPEIWVPPFFVIDFETISRCEDDNQLADLILRCGVLLGIQATDHVMVRSSGVDEFIQNRGLYESKESELDLVHSTIKEILKNATALAGKTIHWIVQKLVRTEEKGGISNEWRISKEPRDWHLESFGLGRPRLIEAVALRRWRDGSLVKLCGLKCNTVTNLNKALKPVIQWADQFDFRMLFEWVWDGEVIHIVQTEPVPNQGGIEPIVPWESSLPTIKYDELEVFSKAILSDCGKYNKLKNARLYEELEYTMPSFYILSAEHVAAIISGGQISPEILRDLEKLTQRPLVIRTDGECIPSGKTEMLPRSDTLFSAESAKEWILGKFTAIVKESELASAGIVMIAHHFIPSQVSAWVRAEPNNRIVRIESLWGIPEGLYWYSHDAYEIDTKSADFLSCPAPAKFKIFKRLRFKGRFIYPDEHGDWVPKEVDPRFGWRDSIGSKNTLRNLANSTRRIAEHTNQPISVMWFIQNHPSSTKHIDALPWYHSKSEISGPFRPAPRKKYLNQQDTVIHSEVDWANFKECLSRGELFERVIIEPLDPSLIRNNNFAKELAELSVLKKFIVELAGGILSHAYYILRRGGAQVECVDLFGVDEEEIEFNKLVRDKIPDIIKKHGEKVTIIKLKGDAIRSGLMRKLVEESLETYDSKDYSSIMEELSDVLEVMHGICSNFDISFDDVERQRQIKLEKRGGFEDGLMLLKTLNPHSLSSSQLETNQVLFETLDQNGVTATDNSEFLRNRVLKRPDLRKGDNFIEKSFSIESDLQLDPALSYNSEFPLPISENSDLNFVIGIDVKRVKSILKLAVRLRMYKDAIEGTPLPGIID